MLPALDEVEFLRRVCIRTVLRREHFAAIVPAESIGVADAPREDFERRVSGLRIDTPQAGRNGRLAAAKPVGVRAG
jgi:hypothetical protein